MIKGIDVSSWQGNIDFGKVKASGIDFVIIRAGPVMAEKQARRTIASSRITMLQKPQGLMWVLIGIHMPILRRMQ